MTDKNNPFPLMVSVVVLDTAQLTAVYALLGSASVNPLHLPPGVSRPVRGSTVEETEVREDTNKSVTAVRSTTPEASLAAVRSTTPEASLAAADSEIDAYGYPWSADLHASTKGKTKDGLWRMKVGVTRPAPLPGFPVENGVDTGTSPETPTPSATDQEGDPPATSTNDEDEFAAFRNAADASDKVDETAAANVPARTYSDADLGALCNQAAVKLGDPLPIKEIIAQYVPEGQVAHSRNIPEDTRADFVATVEAKAGIEFVG